MKKLGKSQGNSWKTVKVREKSGEDEIVSANVFENVNVVHFISIFCQRIRVIGVISCYTADELKSGKNILGQEKVRENCLFVCVLRPFNSEVI